MTPQDRLEARCRLLLSCYSKRWRERHEDELVSVLLEAMEAEGRSGPGPTTSLDLVGHGLEDRLDSILRRVPERLRRQTASAALVVAAGLSLLLLVGEVIGARARPPAEEIEHFGEFFISGPFMTIGVGLYLAFMTSALLVVWSRAGLARVLLLTATAYSAWMLVTAGGAYPVPRAAVLVMFVGLGVLASLATLELGRPARRRLVSAGAAVSTLAVVGLLLTKPLLGWSVGTMTTSGNVAAAALAVVLPVLAGASILLAVSLRSRWPGWAAALAVTGVPLVLYCTAISVSVNPVHTASRSIIPLAYVLVLTCVAAVASRRTNLGRATQ